MGDLLCTLPVVSSYYKLTGDKPLFLTVEYCEPLVELLNLQECIDRAITVPHPIEDFSQGGQPWKIEPELYGYQCDTLYSLGFESWPYPTVSDYVSRRTGLAIDTEFVLHVPVTEQDIEKNKNILYTDRQMYVDRYGATLIDSTGSFLRALIAIKASGRFIGAFSSLAAACALARIRADVFLGMSTPQNIIRWRRDIVRYHPGCYFGDTSLPVPKEWEHVLIE